jgi:hypothetical protein
LLEADINQAGRYALSPFIFNRETDLGWHMWK